jgi:hypothetical protein
MLVIAISHPSNNSVVSSSSPASNSSPGAQSADLPQKESWSYGENTDQMTGKTTKWACLDSADKLQLDFPYKGGSTGSICIRKGARLDAYFKIDKGQVMCGVDGCEARLRVDGGEPFTMGGSEAADDDSRYIFFNSYSRVFAIAKRAKQVKIEVLYYQGGRQVLTFEPSQPLDQKW